VTVWTSIGSPLGELLVARDGEGITDLYLPSGRHRRDPKPDWTREDTAFDDLRRQLGEYFAGTRTDFDLPLAPRGSVFQLRVWAGLLTIGHGQTLSYGRLADRLGLAANSSRAVGLANGQNPISIIIPCHRVIGADGSLTGYGGGLPAKRWLLDHESRQADLFAL
jgi:methylated-DNA-[protein]-cysteine S-methyltransferase